MPTAKVLNYRSIKGQRILKYTTSTDLIEQLIEKSRRKVGDGVEGYMADFAVRQFKKTDNFISAETPEGFVRSLVDIKFLEILDN